MVYGGSNFVLVDDEVVCHDLYDFERDYTSEELHGRCIIGKKARRIRWLLHDEKPERTPAAAAFVDACAPNYAHWLTEVLPRIAIFCANEQFKNIPIVVNDGLHRNIMEALLMVTGANRKIYLLPVGRALQCDVLYLTSATGYVPFDWRSKKSLECSHGLFSPMAFEVLCQRLKSYVQTIKPNNWPEKIYLRRNSEIRNIVNSVAIEKFFESNGYTVIEPEKLTFAQQVAIFTNAKAIVGSSGAALANLIFTPPGSDVLIFFSKHPDTIYWYWQNIACACGKTVKYVLGDISDSKLAGIHSSFSVDVDNIVPFIAKVAK
jgi:capsular polysaccharide biosynthesis protein